MATQAWSPGTLYTPGSIVRPRGAQGVDVGQPDNPGFETGDISDWSYTTVGGSGTPVGSAAQKYAGTYSVYWNGGVGSGSEGGIECILINDDRAIVNPGQSITAICFIMYNPAGHQAGSRGACRLNWYDASNNFITYSEGSHIAGRGNNGRWVQAQVTAVAPANAAFASIGAWLTARNGDIYADSFSWDYAFSGVPTGLVFRAVQTNAGYSGGAEPAWPDTNGETVVDNEVTWEAILTSRVTWEASPILKSGSSEPTWPTLEGGSVVDGTISWVATTGRIEDENNPQTKVVAIAASKIFAGDRDIIPFSATTNALDWTSSEDAGYLPFGLQTYGSTPVEALGLYRSNLVAFNAEGFQMWQVDQDPANMALLDAVAVSCPFPKTPQPVGNDLVFLSPKGFRNMNIAGASTNLQAGTFGESIDPLVTPKIKAGTYEPFSLFWPAFGQFWGIFGDEAFVLTVNGPKDLSWSRFVFPEVITDWTLHGSELYLRTADDKVWHVSDEALRDDMDPLDPDSGVDFSGVIHWPHLDFGSIGVEKSLEGFDLVTNAPEGVAVSIGYDQRNINARTPDYDVDADTIPGQMVPMPVTAPSFDLRLTFAPNQEWEWFAANIYLQDRRAGK